MLISAEKYCTLVEKEGGLQLLEDLIHHLSPPLAVKHLAAIVIENCKKFQEHGWQDVEALLDG